MCNIVGVGDVLPDPSGEFGTAIRAATAVPTDGFEEQLLTIFPEMIGAVWCNQRCSRHIPTEHADYPFVDTKGLEPIWVRKQRQVPFVRVQRIEVRGRCEHSHILLIGLEQAHGFG